MKHALLATALMVLPMIAVLTPTQGATFTPSRCEAYGTGASCGAGSITFNVPSGGTAGGQYAAISTSQKGQWDTVSFNIQIPAGATSNSGSGTRIAIEFCSGYNFATFSTCETNGEIDGLTVPFSSTTGGCLSDGGLLLITCGDTATHAISMALDWTGHTIQYSVDGTPTGAAQTFTSSSAPYLTTILEHRTASGNPTQFTLTSATYTGTALTAPDSTITVTGLSGFYTDSFGTQGIARFNSNTPHVRTYQLDNPSAINQIATATTTNCNASGLNEGITEYQKADGTTFMGYLDCDGTGATNALKIRSATLGNPDQSGTLCEGATFCNDFQLQTDAGGIGTTCPGSSNQAFPPKAGQIGTIYSFPISYEGGGTDARETQKVALSFAYVNKDPSAANGGGNLGVFVDLVKNNVPDKSCGLEVPFSQAGSSSQICTWKDQVTGQDYVAGVSSTGGSRIWSVTIDPHFGDVFFDAPEVTIKRLHYFPAPYDRSIAVACPGPGSNARKDVMVMSSTGRTMRFNVTGPQIFQDPNWPTDGIPASFTSTAVNTLGWSGDGKWYAFIDNNGLQIGNATNGALLGTRADLLTGTLREVFMDDTGCAVTAATSTTIARYLVFPFTTGTCIPAGTRCDSTGCYTVNPDGTTQDIPQNADGTCPSGYFPVEGTTNCRKLVAGGTVSTPTGLFGDVRNYDLTGGRDATKGGLFLSILWILAGAAMGATIIQGGGATTKIWGAGLGATLFFLLLYFFGDIPPLVTFSLIAIAIGLIGLRIRSNASAGE